MTEERTVTDNQIAVMRQALEALQDIKDDCSGCEFEWSNDYPLQAKAKLALEEALAKQEQDEKRKLLPRCFADYQPNHTHDRKCEWCAVNTECQTGEQPKQEQGEPVAFKIYLPKTPRQDVNHGLLPWVYDQDPSSGNVASMWVTPVKNTPQQRTWVGMTEQEQGAIMEDLNAHGTRLYEFAAAIEAKLKEKNT